MARTERGSIKNALFRLIRKKRMIDDLKTPMNESTERRRDVRIPCHASVRCSFVDAEARQWISYLRDLSEGGIQVIVPEKLQPQHILKLDLQLDEDSHPLPCAVQVVWTRAVAGASSSYYAGLSFLDVEGEGRQLIRQTVRQYLERSKS